VIHTDLGSPLLRAAGPLVQPERLVIEQGIEVEFSRPASPRTTVHTSACIAILRLKSPSRFSLFSGPTTPLRPVAPHYNHERPHEALGMQCPADLYHHSTRRLNENDKPLVYPKHFEVKVVSTSGHLSHEGRNYHVGEAFSATRRPALRSRRANRAVLANVHLGTLTLNPDDPWRPPAFITPARPSEDTPAKPKPERSI